MSPTTPGERLRIASVPPPFPDDPYLDLYYRALEAHGFELCPDRRFGPGWLWRQRGRVVGFHVHWLHLFVDRPSTLAGLAGFLRIAVRLLVLKAMSYRLFYTMHNLEAHEPVHPVLDRALTRLIVKLSDQVFVHGRAGAELVRRRHPRARLVTLPHFSSGVHFPAPVPRDEARRALALEPGTRIYLGYGKLRAYKGLDLAIEAFRRGAGPDERLVIAGQPETAAIAGELRDQAGDDPRIRLDFGFVPPDRVALYFSAADLAVFPYRRLLTSGGIGIALHYGIPVLASRCGSIPELVPAQGGILVEPGSVEALAAGLVQSRDLDRERARQACLARDRELSWDAIARVAASAYRESLHPQPRRGS